MNATAWYSTSCNTEYSHVTLNVDCVKVCDSCQLITQTLSWILSAACGTAGIHNTSKTGSYLQVNAILYILDTLYRESSFNTALNSVVLL